MSSTNDLVLSIIVTTHHRVDLLKRALESIKLLGDQVEIVLCADEGSPQTREVAADHLRDHDIFISLPRCHGPSETRNAGISLAQGPFIGFLDDDDTINHQDISVILGRLTPEKVHFANYTKLFEKPVLGSLPEEISRTNKSTKRKPVGDLWVRNHIHIAALFIPTHFAKKAFFRSDLEVSEDWEYILQLAEMAEFQHHELNVANWHQLIDESSRNQKGRRVRLNATKYIYALHPAGDVKILRKRDNRIAELSPRDKLRKEG